MKNVYIYNLRSTTLNIEQTAFDTLWEKMKNTSVRGRVMDIEGPKKGKVEAGKIEAKVVITATRI